MMNEFERQDSRKRRRLSERRRVFGRLGLNSNNNNNNTEQLNNKFSLVGGGERSASGGSLSNQSSSNTRSGSSSGIGIEEQQHMFQMMTAGGGSRTNSDSHTQMFALSSDNTKISMKIQFHITVAPDNEPLILDTSHLQQQQQQQPKYTPPSPVQASCPALASSNPSSATTTPSSPSIGDSIHQKLIRQTSSTRRRQHLLAMHNQSGLVDSAGPSAGSVGVRPANANSDDDILARQSSIVERSSSSGIGEESSLSAAAAASQYTRDSGVRSSTISDGISDEATLRFLARQQQTRPSIGTASPLARNSIQLQHQQQQQQFHQHRHSSSASSGAHHNQSASNTNIYFKRDGQRFGHEFTLKLAVDRTYRCLLKVRPLIPLQGISIQGHQVLFVDCSQNSNRAAHFPSESCSAPASASSIISRSSPHTTALTRSWHDIQQQKTMNNHHHLTKSHTAHHHNHNHNHNLNNHHQNHRHPTQQTHTTTATTLHNSTWRHASVADLNATLYHQQQSQMLRYFAASHCSSTSNSHLGGQLIYMFDWSAGRFEVNKNKARTEVQAVLKFKNGEILSLPLQIKFYQPECKQHLNWGSQLHFIDYDCNINNMGQIKVHRVQYY